MIPFMGETVCRAFNLVFIAVFLLLLREIKDRCDKNRGCQEITKQRYERNQDRREKIKDSYKN